MESSLSFSEEQERAEHQPEEHQPEEHQPEDERPVMTPLYFANSQAFWRLDWNGIRPPENATTPAGGGDYWAALEKLLHSFLMAQLHSVTYMIDEREDSWARAFQSVAESTTLLSQSRHLHPSLCRSLSASSSGSSFFSKMGLFSSPAASSGPSHSPSSPTVPPAPAPADSSATLHLELIAVLSAQLTLLRSLVYFRHGSIVKGAWHTRSAWKQFSKLSATTPRPHFLGALVDSELLLGLGFFNFFISLIPSRFIWILESMGFPTDRQLGIRCFNTCVELRMPASTAARLLLLWAHIFFFEDFPESERLIQQTAGPTAESPFFAYLAGYYWRHVGHSDRAIALFESVRHRSQQIALTQLELDALYEIGWCHFRDSRFADASACFERFLHESPIQAFRCYCAWQHGVALDMIGEHPRALEWMGRVKGMQRREYSFDAFAVRKAAEYLDPAGHPLPELQRNLLLLSNASKSHSLSQEDVDPLLRSCEAALGPSGPLFASPLRPDYLLELFLIQAKIAQKLEPQSPDRYVFYINEALQLAPSVQRESYLLVEALALLTEHWLDLNNAPLAREALNRAKTQIKSTADFEKPLSRRLHALHDRLLTLSQS